MKKSLHESGRSMVELVGVLSITGLITAGAFVLIRSGMASQKRSRTADEVATIVAGTRALSAEKEDFSNLPAAPTSYTLTGGPAKLAGALLGANAGVATPLSSSSFYAVHQASGDSAKFSVVLSGIPTNDCTTLASRGWDSATSVSCPATPGTRLTITYGKD